MTKQNILKLSFTSFLIAIIVFVFDYLFYHFVTDDGISIFWHEEVGKPFITEIIGDFGVLFLFFSIITFLVACICFKNDNSKK